MTNAHADDPERERRLAAFGRWEQDSPRVRDHAEAFKAGCAYEAGLLEDLLERMARQTRDEFELLKRVAAVLESWAGTMDDHAHASLVFDRVKAYVKMRAEMAKFEEKDDGGHD